VYVSLYRPIKWKWNRLPNKMHSSEIPLQDRCT
jgi:hypothetical protein